MAIDEPIEAGKVRLVMKTLTLEAEVSADGVLRLEAPVGLPPGRVEVVLVVQPKNNGLYKVREIAPRNKVQTDEPMPVSPYESSDSADRSTIAAMGNREKWDRLAKLMDTALAGISWAEIEEGRRGRDFGG
jgi:hypothetical protein